MRFASDSAILCLAPRPLRSRARSSQALAVLRSCLHRSAIMPSWTVPGSVDSPQLGESRSCYAIASWTFRPGNLPSG